ncbi:hypothetical protein GCM10010912_35780 [Paenibacillus albidus]|uniref:Sporulation stage II protein D amidase enhancer LytB N-terminal domain-containing protein n=1 Tax=Paenibacillus albidus TaxID=2041023 RepID=A0A917CFZ8_9BACL|nr:stage II sporulation protein D [Paenibacillus albidus]GGF87347.1 hypothetical protein GCM10010912_35780 [Paenibacillus albidus]
MKELTRLRRKMTRLLQPRRGTPRLARLAPAAWLAAPLLAALLLPLAVVPLHRAAAPSQPPPALPLRTAAPAARAPVQAPGPAPEAAAADAPQPNVSVYLSQHGQIETLPLEDYVSGVLAAEMPPSFELEALKAQAVAARTFIARRLLAGDASGVPVPGADVTDTVSHQAYVSQDTLEREWVHGGRSAELAKLRRAAQETRGVIMTYQGQPITASFFASSGGRTENSEEYWNAAVPYLRSVASPWDSKITPKYAVTTTFSLSEIQSKLGIRQQAIPVSRDSVSSGSSRLPIELLSRTTGRKVKEISIGGHVFTGREVREKLGLRSSQFTWKRKGNKVEITTYGNGHGVGMSQWGANGMAMEGGTATQILKHYYSGVYFTQISTLLKK